MKQLLSMKLSGSFRYRNFWLGCGMVLIMLYHASPDIAFRPIQLLNVFGYGGVDIFIFASGIGCYYSLSKDPDPLRFLKRRFLRLAPAYVCFIIPWMLWRNIAVPLSVQAVLGNLFGLQFFISYHDHFNWYLSGMILFYLLTPYFKQFTDSKKSVLWDALMVLALIVVCIPFWNAGTQIMVILARFPIYYLGLVYAKLARQERTVSIWSLLAHLLLAYVGWRMLHFVYFRYYDYLWSYGLYWYPFILIIPGVCLLLSKLAELMDKLPLLRPVVRLVQLMGVYSFELYLVHSFLYAYLMGDILVYFSQIPENVLWLLTIPVVILGSFLLNRAAALLSFLCRKCTAMLSPLIQ